MNYDVVTMAAVAAELERLVGSRVARVDQPAALTVILELYGGRSTHRLLLCADAALARAHLTTARYENPARPPAFCQLLRSRLDGARLTEVAQCPLERHLVLGFSAPFAVQDGGFALHVEVMGRHSNIVLVGSDGRVVDAVKRVGADRSRVRQILPSLEYSPPPPRAPLLALPASAEEVAAALERAAERAQAEGARGRAGDRAAGRVPDPVQLLQTALPWLGPVLAREVAWRAGLADAAAAGPAGARGEDAQRLAAALEWLWAALEGRAFAPRTYHDADGAPTAFAALPLAHLAALEERPAPTMNEALDRYYAAREVRAALDGERAALTAAVSAHLKRLEKKLALQLESAGELQRAGELRRWGELLTAALHAIEPGAKEALVPDFAAPGAPPVLIPLDPRLSAAANAQRLFARYRRARRTGEASSREAARSRAEFDYLESVLMAIETAGAVADLAEIRDELAQAGYQPARQSARRGGKVQARAPARRPSPPAAAPPGQPLRFVSSDGLTILIGRNNKQNDYLTLRLASPDDVWLHVKDAPGTHVVLRLPPRQEPPDTSLLEAAAAAAYFSRLRHDRAAGVDYTRCRYVRKPRGAKPGMVIYDHHHTLMVAPALPAALLDHHR